MESNLKEEIIPMESRNPQESIDSPDNKEEQNSSKSEGSITDALEWTYDEIIKHQTKKPAIYLKHVSFFFSSKNSLTFQF